MTSNQAPGSPVTSTPEGVRRGQQRAATRIQQALELAFEIWGEGGWISIEKGRAPVVIPPEHCAPSKAHERRAAKLSAELVEVISAARKPWASAMREVVLVPNIRAGAAVEIAALVLEERRVIGPARRFRLPAATAELNRFAARASGVLLPPLTVDGRVAVGIVLGSLGLLGHATTITEVPANHGTDHRQLIAGSHWFDAGIAISPDDLSARALLVAMQARSYRRDFLKIYRSAYYASLAAGRLDDQGAETSDIAARLGISEKFAQNIVTQHRARRANAPDHAGQGDPISQARALPAMAPAMAPDEPAAGTTPEKPRRASRRQAELVEDILKKYPYLAAYFGDDWRLDSRQAYAKLNAAFAATKSIAQALTDFRGALAVALQPLDIEVTDRIVAAALDTSTETK